MNAPASTATSFTALPHALHLSCLTLLPLEDILAMCATDHDMRHLCADDVVWRAIYEDVVSRCRLQGMGCTSAQQEQSLQSHKRPVEQQANYKHKTLTHILAIF